MLIGKVAGPYEWSTDPDLMDTADAAPWEYDQVALGLNYRMTELGAAIGRVQLEKLPEIVRVRGDERRQTGIVLIVCPGGGGWGEYAWLRVRSRR